MPTNQPSGNLFSIEESPTDDDAYNRIHAECEMMATMLVVEDNPNSLKIVNMFRVYRDFMSVVLDEGDPEETDEQFISWLQDADKHREETDDWDSEKIDSWEVDILRALDKLFIQKIEDTDLSPREVFDRFDRYVEQATERVEQTHGLEGFFENVE